MIKAAGSTVVGLVPNMQLQEDFNPLVVRLGFEDHWLTVSFANVRLPRNSISNDPE